MKETCSMRYIDDFTEATSLQLLRPLPLVILDMIEGLDYIGLECRCCLSTRLDAGFDDVLVFYCGKGTNRLAFNFGAICENIQWCSVGYNLLPREGSVLQVLRLALEGVRDLWVEHLKSSVCGGLRVTFFRLIHDMRFDGEIVLEYGFTRDSVWIFRLLEEVFPKYSFCSERKFLVESFLLAREELISRLFRACGVTGLL
ncbi:hypothetical protein AVEN_66137-1 [Araneus ventricosus]|uniref:Uncharacterized protein n=1 Tax=Araneus ventricosus TaxID=182803 RepID=A0A4Y2HHX8_ARAVE|nr:hypothetical protein AVEN_66137-1 [Araneus ventricosus]